MSDEQDRRTLAERMRRALPGMSPSERSIVRHLLAISSAEEVATVASVSERAGVSPPTVLRCLAKIGFNHFGDFREVAVSELAAKHESALQQMSRRRSRDDGQPRRMVDSFVQALTGTFDRLDLSELNTAIDLLCDSQRRPVFTGGRFSHSLAEQLHAHVAMMRPGAELISYTSHGRAGRLADMGRTHLLTVFDFRRYQRDTVQLAHAAKRKRAKLLLITDQWMSPIADWADCVLVAEVQSASPFDSLVPAMALTEVLIDAVYGRLGAGATERLARLEAENEGFEWNSLITPLSQRAQVRRELAGHE
jgi:DNA-binding MurR/RpiR family transcriptional regulator